MSRKHLSRLAIAAAFFLTGVSAPAAIAETDLLSTPVHYGDLDLTQKAGVDRLVRRLNWAAEIVCPSIPHGPARISGRVSDSALACRQQAIRKAVADIGLPELAARLDPVRPYRLASH